MYLFIIDLIVEFFYFFIVVMMPNTSCGLEMICTPTNTHSGITSEFRTQDQPFGISSPS